MVVIYLTAPTLCLLKRVKKRGHKNEIKAYNAAYFEKLDQCYRLALELCGCEYRIVDWSEHREQASAAAQDISSTFICDTCCMSLISDSYASSDVCTCSTTFCNDILVEHHQ